MLDHQGEATKCITISGRELECEDGSLRNFIAMVRSDSRDIESYLAVVKSMVDGDELRSLAARLVEHEHEHVLESASNTGQAPGQIVVCRDDVKTIFISHITPVKADAVNAVREGSSGPRATARGISVAANDALYLVLGRGRLGFRRYRVAGAAAVADAAAGLALEHVEDVVCRSGEMVLVRGEIETIDIAFVDEDVWLLELVLNEHAPLVRHFDRETLQQTGVSSSNFHATRLEFVFELFKRFGHSEAGALLEKIQRESRFHFVRWKAVQTLVHVDRKRAPGALQRASEDAHPHVRAAAVRTLDNLTAHGLI